jgi:hypothetical protein
MEKNDPAGEYRVKAKVSDLNADVSFELRDEVPFEVDRRTPRHNKALQLTAR